MTAIQSSKVLWIIRVLIGLACLPAIGFVLVGVWGIQIPYNEFWRPILSLSIFIAIAGYAAVAGLTKHHPALIILAVVAAGVLVFLSWPAPLYKTRTARFAKDVAAAIDPSELQQWAITTLEEDRRAGQPLYQINGIPLDKIPSGLRRLKHCGAPYVFCSRDSYDVWLEWGCWMCGHWGLRVGPQSFKVEPSDTMYYVEWKPGIYFFETLVD
jgi:hypothetical protein